MTVINEYEIVFLFILALVLGGLIGLERERHERPAGFRTHILVSLGSSLLMMVSINVALSFPETDADPGRIAAQVVSGIGFLGAGTILREGLTVKGLTTAASLWAVAAIGLAAGGGYYFIAIITTLMAFITLFFFSRLELKIDNAIKIDRRLLFCKIVDQPGVLGKIGLILGSRNINIENVNIDRDKDEGELLIELELQLPANLEIGLINQDLLEIEELKEIDWNEL